jgi:hypothetical protein
MSVKIQVKRASAASWTSVNPILDLGEFGLESDTNKLKIGTGVAWNSTDYLSETYQLGTLQDVSITNAQNGDFLRYSNSASAWINDPVNLATDTVGNYVQSLVAGTGVTLSNNSGEGSTPTVAVGQDVATSASVTFAAVTAPLVGNASTATTLQTSRSISLTGDVSGSVSFNGSQDVSISATVQPNSVALGTDTTGNYVNDVVAGTGITVTHTPGEGSSASVALNATLDDISNVDINTFTLASGDVIEWNGTNWHNTNKLTIFGFADLDDYNNPVFGPPANGTVLTRNSSTGKWEPTQPNYALGTQTTGNYVQSLVAGTGLTITDNSGEGATPTVAIGQSVATSASPTFGSLSTTGALYVGTDIHVGGVYYTTTETNLAIEDSFIYLNDGNTISDPDLGFAGNYNDGTYRHAGVFSDASDSHKFKFFKGYEPEPTNPINTSHASYTHADVIANTFESKVATGTAPFTVASTTVVTNLNADLLDGNSSTYFLNGTTSVLDDFSNVSAAGAADGEFLRYNSGTSSWVSTTTKIDDLKDVSASAPSSGQFLKWNGTAWVPDSVPTINALDDIGDVSASAPSDGQFLKYSSSASAWVADSIPTINALDDIGNVTAPTPTTGEVLLWNGTAWVDSNVVRDNLVRFYMEVM